MKRFLVFLFFAYCLFFCLLGGVYSQDRYATCDMCGYCPPNQPPSNWESCRRCLYESASSNPNTFETLKINNSNNLPPTPMPGRWYTMLGCISTDLGSFQQHGAAASVVQILLNLIFSVVGLVAFLYLLYGSYIIITSRSDPEKIIEGKRIVVGAIIGVIFTLSSVFIVRFIASDVLRIPGFGG